MKVFYGLFLCVMIPLTSIFSQSSDVEGGVILGATSYSGDVNPTITPRFKDIGVTYGLAARVALTNKFNFRSSLTSHHFQADDKDYPERGGRNFKFSTNLYELALVGEWEPFGKEHFYGDAQGNKIFKRLISPYFYTGVMVGLATANPDFSGYKDNNPAMLAGIRQDLSHGSANFVISMPLGFGIKYDLSERMVIALDGSLRLCFSDYLDGISKAAGPTRNDLYSSMQVMVFYKFRKR
jgi:Domain of unknown function (DUF6089)